MNVVVVGASSGIGAAVAREYFNQGANVVLSARSERDLSALASDFHLRAAGGQMAHVVAIDLLDKDFDLANYLRTCVEKLGHVDILVLSAGEVRDDDNPWAARTVSSQILDVNYRLPAELLSEFTRYFAERNAGTCVVFSSIAAAVPRKRNVNYSAAKRALENYCMSLRHALVGKPVNIRVIAWGYVDTSMSFGRKLLFPVISVERAARYAVRTAHWDAFSYYPRFWTCVVSVLRWLPWFIYKRLNF